MQLGIACQDDIKSVDFANFVYKFKRRFEYKKRLLPRCIHHFKPDLINNMDHMRISGTEPSLVILRQTK